jgi:hypothetical protein
VIVVDPVKGLSAMITTADNGSKVHCGFSFGMGIRSIATVLVTVLVVYKLFHHQKPDLSLCKPAIWRIRQTSGPRVSV